MPIQVKLLAGMILVSAMLLSASGHPKQNDWSNILLRRHLQQPYCTSYDSLQDLMTNRFIDYARNTVRKLFNSGPPVTGSGMRVASVSLCREMSIMAVEVRREIENCRNSEDITANFHVFSGLCLENGAMTNFLDGLLAGFESVNYDQGNPCSQQIEPVMHTCLQFLIPHSLGMRDGPIEYKRNIIKQEACIAKGFDSVNVTTCGNVESLKRLSHIFNLFIPVAPGVTFQLSEFNM